MKVAITIKTEEWNRIITVLVHEGWRVRSKYRGIDAGIDNDFLVLFQKTDKIIFGWTNYFEGEIQCDDELFGYLEKKFEMSFVYGAPTALSAGFFTKETPKSFYQWFKNLFSRSG